MSLDRYKQITLCWQIFFSHRLGPESGTFTCLRRKLLAVSQKQQSVKMFSIIPCASFALSIILLSFILGLSFHPSSTRPQFDPGIFSVWCTIIRPSRLSFFSLCLPFSTLTRSLSLHTSHFLSVLFLNGSQLSFFVSVLPSLFHSSSSCLPSVLCCLSLNSSS